MGELNLLDAVKLIGAGRYFLCRGCYGLSYGSQRERGMDRALRKADKARMKLGGKPGMDSFFPDKPKGMHWHTYHRLMQEAANGSPAQALKLLGRWHRGPVYSSPVSGDHVCFGSGDTIRVLRTNEDASTSREVASIDTSGVVRDLYVSGSHHFVADDSGALIIIDISDPENPKETGRAKLREYVRAVFVEGHYAYMAALRAGLVLIDVSDPAQPRIVTTHKTRKTFM